MTKYIQLQITEEQHKQIKLRAIDAGKSMKDYILDCLKHPPAFGKFDFKIIDDTKESKPKKYA